MFLLREGRRILRSFKSESEALERYNYLVKKTPWEDIELYRSNRIDLCDIIRSHSKFQNHRLVNRNILHDLEEIVKYYRL